MEVYCNNFSWRKSGRGVLEVRYDTYVVGLLPHFRVKVELEVYPSNFNWRNRGRGGVEVR